MVATHDGRGPGPGLAVSDIQLDLSRRTCNVVAERDCRRRAPWRRSFTQRSAIEAPETPTSAGHEHDLALESSHGNIMRSSGRQRQCLRMISHDKSGRAH
jgi:hypothetical protein